MKKILLILSIGAFAACNDSATTTESTSSDSSKITIDSTAVAPPAPMDTSSKMSTDTSKMSKMPTDTTKKK